MLEHDEKAGIYRIVVKRGAQPDRFYIGQTKRFSLRKKSHWRELERGKHYNSRLQDAFNKYGPQAFSFEILLVCEPDRYLLARHEQETVDSFDLDDLYNVRLECVTSSLGIPASPERREKIAAALKGIKRSKETRDKIGAAQAWKRTPEGKAKMSAAARGKHHSPESREKMRVSRLGRKMSAEAIAKRAETNRRIAEARGTYYSAAWYEACAAAAQKRRGVKQTAEHIERSASARRGKKRPVEVCAKISAALKGRKLSDRQIEILRAANVGRKLTLEHREKLSAARRGKKRSDETKAKMRASALAYLARKKAAELQEVSQK